MYSIKETADIFGVHWQTVRNWINSGKLKAMKVGRVIRISEDEIERLKKECIVEVSNDGKL